LPATTGLTRGQERALALVTGATVANAYYIHPIVSDVARDFGIGMAMIGLVPALNQIALAVGIFLLLPLGDRYGNRTLCIVFGCCQAVALTAMAMAQQFWLFVAASTVLGFFTIAPYILPAYASKRVEPERLGHVTATITAGIIFGILVARVGAGWIAEHLDWRVVYWIATGVIVTTTLSLPLVMEGRRPATTSAPQMSYPQLVWSLFPLLAQHREVMLSGLIQALNFGIFIAVWLGLALYLTSPAMGYGTDVVGYLAGLAAVSIFVTPRLGRLADRVGPRKARSLLAILQFAGVLLLWPLGHSLWLLLVPVVVMNAVGPSINVTSTMTFLGLEPAIRTRLMTGFIVMMFIGGGLSSWAGTAAYAHWGWAGTSVLAAILSLCIALLSRWAMRFGR
jgi:predicted MFS family arabinose efflux permease